MDDVDLRRMVRYCKCIAGTANESDEALVQIRMDVSIKEAGIDDIIRITYGAEC